MVTILGDGAWGTAIAQHMALQGYNVILWCNDERAAHSIQTTNCNTPYLPDIKLASSITATTDLELALTTSTWIFGAIPVKYMRSVLTRAQSFIQPEHRWIMLSKGIEQDTLLLPTQIIDDVLGYAAATVVISGPSFAHDLVRQQVTGFDIACDDHQLACEVSALLTADYIRTHVLSDVIGVQLCAALKNVIALGIGMLDGAGYMDNTKAYFLTRGLQEMAIIVAALGGNPQTVYGLSGVGDLVLTAMGHHSRNTALGRRLGRGETLSALAQESGTMPEGINTVASLYQLIQKHNLDMPLCKGLYQVVFGGAAVEEMVG